MTVWSLAVLSLFVYIQSSFTTNRKIDIPSNTHHLLYTNYQQHIIAASSTKVSIYWGINGTYLTDLDLQSTQQVTAIAISSDSNLIAIGFEDGQIQTYYWKNQQLEPDPLQSDAVSAITAICISKDEKTVVYSSQDGQVYLQDITSGHLIDSITFENKTQIQALSCQRFSNQDSTNYFVAGGGNQDSSKLVLYEFDTEIGQNITYLYQFPSHQGLITSTVFSIDGTVLYAANNMGKIYKYNLKDYQQKQIQTQSSDSLFELWVSDARRNLLATINSQQAIIIHLDNDGEIQKFATDGTCIGFPASGVNFIIINNQEATIYGACPQPQFYNFEDNDCQACLQQCKLCFNSSDTCYECTSGFYLDNQSCNFCGEGCLQCSVPNNCTLCNTDAHFVKNLTTGNCQCYQTYYYKDKQCKECSEVLIGCIKCLNQSICTQCDQAQHRQLKGSHCRCQQGYYENSQKICELCPIKHCIDCLNESSCIKCNEEEHWILNKRTQLCACETHYTEIEDTCVKCPIGCLKCDKNGQCLSCDQQQNFDPHPEAGQCKCKDRFYFYEEFGTCEPCITGCLKCKTSDFCIACDSSSHFIENPDTSRCICQQSYYLSQQRCIECNKTLKYCQSCFSETQCEKCAGQLFVKDGKCTCGPGKYVTSKNNCVNCQLGCYYCENSSECITCDLSKHFTRNISSNKCQCEVSYFLDEASTCISCRESIPNCIQCKSKYQCTRCDQMAHRISVSGKCVCMQKYFQNQNKLCIECGVANCKTCENVQKCLMCDQGYYLEDGICQGQQGINIWLIIGPILGGILLLVFGVGIVIIKRRRRYRQSQLTAQQSDASQSLIVPGQ